ncbi:MAG: protein-L-isoaspartate(D-aspartate) O-methyltransferase [Planctomycetes bacterium]|nr:protein-L-isoaspartate(D-aspartate) O-methyltransferase [Planctomycetota bacterium]
MVSFDKNDKYEILRAKMVKNHLMRRDISDPAVLDVFRRLPRELFVPAKYAEDAYGDFPIPIGIGQTISQPYIVALMTQCLRLNDRCTVLELGTGSGYQAAILAMLAKKVYTIERLPMLSEGAQAVIGDLGIENVEFYIGDGSKGWPDYMEFDRIIVTAAMPEVPAAINRQLKNNGLLVAPVGGPLYQDLLVIEKKDGTLYSKNVCSCRFVKLIGKYGFDETA